MASRTVYIHLTLLSLDQHTGILEKGARMPTHSLRPFSARGEAFLREAPVSSTIRAALRALLRARCALRRLFIIGAGSRRSFKARCHRDYVILFKRPVEERHRRGGERRRQEATSSPYIPGANGTLLSKRALPRLFARRSIVYTRAGQSYFRGGGQGKRATGRNGISVHGLVTRDSSYETTGI